MASNASQATESLNFYEDRSKKSLRSAVITENDPLKIKLRISKRDIMEPTKSKREGSAEMKLNRNHRNSSLGRSDEITGEDSVGLHIRGNDDESKRKLRSKREAEDDVEQRKDDADEGNEEKKKRIEKSLDESPCDFNEVIEKPVKKRGRPSKLQIEENERLEEKRRLKRLEMEARGESVDVKESFCWTCHKDGSVVKCDTCPRVFHLKCVSLSRDPSKDWICPECSLVLHAEKISTRSEAMKNLSLDQLCTLLNFAIGRMKNVPESQAFWKPVDPKEVPFYDKYITNPMDLNLLEKNMKAKMYGSPQAFLADAKWLLHNSIIFNSTQSPLTSTARFLVKICRQEMAEIENCPDCYLNAHTKKEWFVEVCRKPHILIWARLKGFPFWPAKAMSTNLKTQSVDARFFGAHDKAWVPVKECYLYSKNSPQFISKKRADLDDAFLEVEAYIKKIKQKYGTFCYAPDKTPFIPEIYDDQLQMMIPSFQEEKTTKKKRKRHITEENGVIEKTVQSGKKLTDHGAQHRFKLKRTGSEDSSTKMSEDICLMNEDVSNETIPTENSISPEDEVAQSLEKFDTSDGTMGETPDDHSTDLEEDVSVPIPEHGYSRNSNSESEVPSASVEVVKEVNEEFGEAIKEVPSTLKESNQEVKDKVISEDLNVSHQEDTSFESEKETENEQCVVSSTSTDKEESDLTDELDTPEKRKCEEDVKEELPNNVQTQSECESLKKDEDRSVKSFTNLSVDQKQKILTEAKLLANIDEMTAIGKQKVLNELGLDASQVDIRELAQENRQILETLNKKGRSEPEVQTGMEIERPPIKSEDFEQYLMEERHQEGESDKEELPPSPQVGIKIGNMKPNRAEEKNPEGNVNVLDPESLRNMQCEKKGPSEDSKKMKLEPVIELIKLDIKDSSLQKLNTRLRLSDEVSLLRVQGENKKSVNNGKDDKKLPIKRVGRPPKVRKNLLNRTRHRTLLMKDVTVTPAPPNINIISVDTENTSAQKNLLKSLCSDDRKSDIDNLNKSCKKTVLITTNDKGIKKVDVTGTEDSGKKSGIELGVESFAKGSDPVKDAAALTQQKNLAVVANSHLILTNSGQTFLTNQNPTSGPTFLPNQGNQGGLALAQNNLGQLSLVHLTNLTSGIQTNFVNLTNDTIGLNNSIGTIYASPGFNVDTVSVAGTGNGPVFLTTSPTTSVSCSPAGGPLPAPTVPLSTPAAVNKLSKPATDNVKQQPRVNRPNSGITVRSPASLGLAPNPTNKPPPPLVKAGEENLREIGSFSAELNRHSIKIAEFMRATIEDILRELSSQGSLEAKYKSLMIEMEKLQLKHQQEITELKNTSERNLMELRTILESEKQKSLTELRNQLEAKHQKIINETKNKQWCANCGKEALFYCCWNTSYCDYPCQQHHWPNHMNRCAQLGNNVQQLSNQIHSKNIVKYQSNNYVPIMSRAGGSQTSAPAGSNRSTPTVQNKNNHAQRHPY